MRSTTVQLLVFSISVLALAACADGSSGSGSSSSGSVGAAGGGGPLRLVGFDRRLITPSMASGRLLLLAERPTGTVAADFVLLNSDGGHLFRVTPHSPIALTDQAAFFDLPMPVGETWYQLAGPGSSNVMHVQPAVNSTVQWVGPAAGANQLPQQPALEVAGGEPSYLFLVVDEAGGWVVAAESDQSRFTVGQAAVTSFVEGRTLEADQPYLLAVLGLNASGYATASSVRRAIRTTP